MDSSESPIYGEQEGSAYNGHFGCMCYHPLFVFNQFGDLERSALRSGNVHSADEWEGTLRPVVARYSGKVARLLSLSETSSGWHVTANWGMLPPHVGPMWTDLVGPRRAAPIESVA
jgi:hypothetical protein